LNYFQELGLSQKLAAKVVALGMTDPTPIQSKAIPLVLEGRDVMGLAQTGTGKTAAFGLPLIEHLLQFGKKPDPSAVRALILAPTRELAKQIQVSLQAFTDGTPLKIGLVVGGASIGAQANRLKRGTDILVATPGRLLDHLERRSLRLDSTQFLVLDEADQMLDLGFIHALRKIAKLIPEDRHTMLFSATMPKQMAEIAEAYLNDPVRVQVSPPGKAADKITQSVHYIAKSEKPSLLLECLQSHRDERAIVFSRTKHGAERMMKSLVAAGLSATSVHGNKSQGQRERAIKAFKSGEAMVLVATDVAARGLDIPDVRHVYNYDLPNVADNYVHRIGRTARAGADGAAVAFCAPDEMDLLKSIEKVMKMTVPVASGRRWEPAAHEGKSKSKFGGKPGGKPGGGQHQRRRRRRNGGFKSAA